MHLKVIKRLNMVYTSSLTNSKAACIKFPLHVIATKRNVQTTAQKKIPNFIIQSSKKLHYDKIKADLSSLTVNNLKIQLRLYNLKVSGKKSELVNRLSNYHVESENNVSSNIIQENLAEKEKLSKRMLREAKKDPEFNKSNETLFSNKLNQMSKEEHYNDKSTKKKTVQHVKTVKLNQKLPLVEPVVQKNKVIKTPPSFKKANMNTFSTNIKNKPVLKPIENCSKKPLPSAKQGNSNLQHIIEFENLPNYSLSGRDITFMISLISFSLLWLLFGV